MYKHVCTVGNVSISANRRICGFTHIQVCCVHKGLTFSIKMADNILVHLLQGRLSPGVICDFKFLWVILDFQPPWRTFPLRKSKTIFQKSYVYEIWLLIHYSLDSGWWLCRNPDHELPTRLLLSALRPSQKSALVNFLCNTSALFSFKYSPDTNLVNSQFFLAIFVKLTWKLYIAALTSCFLFPLVGFTAGRPLASCFLSVAPRFSKFWTTL